MHEPPRETPEPRPHPPQDQPPAVPAPPPVQPTGEAGVDQGLSRLAEAAALPVAGHVQVYEDVHRALRETLAALDRQPPPQPSQPPRPGPPSHASASPGGS